jgi:hypothetical protein
MDVARWGLGVTLPTRVSAMGGHVMFDDDQTTPNVLMVMFEFPDPQAGGDKKKLLQFEVRHWYTNPEFQMPSSPGQTDGYMVHASNTVGNLFFGSKGYMVKTVDEWRTFMGKEMAPGPSGKGLGNHYGNFVEGIRRGNAREFNRSIEEGFYSCALVHLANISYRLGRSLDFDPATMRFRHDDEANAMLTRSYRAPYVVPERV